MVEGDGDDVDRNAAASREHHALCRCGRSQNKPFCSGMHWYVNFADPVPEPEATSGGSAPTHPSGIDTAGPALTDQNSPSYANTINRCSSSIRAASTKVGVTVDAA